MGRNDLPRMARSTRPRRPRRQKILYWLFFFGLLMAVALSILGRGQDRPGGEATIRIEDGATTADIARLLKDEHVIESEKDFLKEAERSGSEGNLRSGLYRFERGEPLETILAKLASGARVPESVLTLPEGFAINDMALEVQARTAITPQQYKSAAQAAGWNLPLPSAAGTPTLEGFLFPSSYDLEEGITADQLVTKQLESFKRETASAGWERAAALGVTPYQALIIASMVEREARVAEERPLVAAVIYNRIEAGMKLEVDATVQYALGSWKEDLTEQDLGVDSPYNTRLYPGLPPAPICNPGLEAIEAALMPAEVDYLFYVATGDEAGHHFFTSSYDEFLQAAGR